MAGAIAAATGGSAQYALYSLALFHLNSFDMKTAVISLKAQAYPSMNRWCGLLLIMTCTRLTAFAQPGITPSLVNSVLLNAEAAEEGITLTAPEFSGTTE